MRQGEEGGVTRNIQNEIESASEKSFATVLSNGNISIPGAKGNLKQIGFANVFAGFLAALEENGEQVISDKLKKVSVKHNLYVNQIFMCIYVYVDCERTPPSKKTLLENKVCIFTIFVEVSSICI